MVGTLTHRERAIRAVLGLIAAIAAWQLEWPAASGTENIVLSWVAAFIAVAAIVTAIAGRAPLARIGLDRDGALAVFAARVFVGWEFAYAGSQKVFGAESSAWVGSNAGDAVTGYLNHAISAPMTSGPFPQVQGWYADLVSNQFLPRAEFFSYLVAFGELAAGIALIIGMFTRIAAMGALIMNLAFLLAGTAGVNPLMIVCDVAVAFAPAAVLYTLGVDRYMLPALHRWWDHSRFHAHPHAGVPA